MSDFDKFLRDRLEEEERFPGLPDNWAKMNGRLDQFGFPQTPRAGWQRFVFPGVATATLGILVILGLKVMQVQRENASLQAQMTVLQEKMTTPPVAPIASNTQSSTIETQRIDGATSTLNNTNTPQSTTTQAARPNLQKAGTTQPDPARSSATANHKVVAPENVANAPANKTTTPEDLSKSPVPVQNKPGAAQNLANTTTPDKSPVNDTAAKGTLPPLPANAPATNDTVQKNAAAVLNSAQDTTKTSAPATNNTTNPEQFAAAQPNSQVQPDSAALLAGRPDSIQTTVPAPVDTTKTIAATPPAAAKIDTAATAVAEVIKKHESGWKPAFYLNAHVLAGNRTGSQSGLSALLGQGLSAEIGILKSLRLTAGVDWLRQDISLQMRRPNFHLPHDDPPHGMEQMLEDIEGTLRQRQISAGLKYVAPLRGRLKPVVQVAYAWRNIPAQIFQFQYKEHHGGGMGPGGPPPHDELVIFAKKSEQQRIKNLLRTGVGIEWQTNRWAFSLGAEYGTDLNKARKTGDDWMVKAGVTYQL